MPQFSSTELVAMGRHIPTPFEFSIESEQDSVAIKIDSLLRIVPGKRLVGLADWKGRTVIVKLFINSNRWKRALLRDIEGVNTLRAAKIPSPNLLLQTSSVDNRAGVIIMEYLRDGKSLAELYSATTSDDEKAEVLEMSVKTIAQCHQAGLWQDDVHLDNFMLSSGAVHVLDGAQIKKRDDPLDTKTRLKNFARFLAQFPVEQDENWPALIELYKLLGAEISVEETADFSDRLRKARIKRLNAFDRKLNRSTTAHRSEQGSNFYYVYDRTIHSEDLERFLKDPDSFLEGQTLLKNGNSSTVGIVQIDERKYVLKRYNIKSFWHGISRAFRPSRAQHSWRNASILEMLGVNTAHPYLYMEERFLWLIRRRAYFLCEYLEGQDLGTAWQEESLSISQAEVANLFRELFRIMDDYRISHGDMKATNFLIRKGKLHVLDLDAMERHKSKASFVEKFRKDIKRFQKNWLGSTMEVEVDKILDDVAQT